jgi:hypothetical protein
LDKLVTKEQLKTLYKNFENGYPAYPKDQWIDLVIDNQTEIGYWDWVSQQLTSEFHENV